MNTALPHLPPRNVPPPKPPLRQVRASYDDATITVYQAYSPEIAEPAVAAGRFVPPFKRERMTWIKPSFLWMMYRSGWAAAQSSAQSATQSSAQSATQSSAQSVKPGQERVLAISLHRNGFEWALANSCLSHYVPELYADRHAWARELKRSPVRVQWDPERSLRMQPLEHRSLQVGLSGVAVDRYVDEWIAGIEDVTALAHEIHDLVRKGEVDAAGRLLPAERPYPLPPDVAKVVGATPVETTP